LNDAKDRDKPGPSLAWKKLYQSLPWGNPQGAKRQTKQQTALGQSQGAKEKGKTICKRLSAN
jgi:hypothetical protein